MFKNSVWYFWQFFTGTEKNGTAENRGLLVDPEGSSMPASRLHLKSMEPVKCRVSRQFRISLTSDNNNKSLTRCRVTS